MFFPHIYQVRVTNAFIKANHVTMHSVLTSITNAFRRLRWKIVLSKPRLSSTIRCLPLNNHDQSRTIVNCGKSRISPRISRMMIFSKCLIPVLDWSGNETSRNICSCLQNNFPTLEKLVLLHCYSSLLPAVIQYMHSDHSIK